MKKTYQWALFIFALVILCGVYFYITQAIESQENKVRKPRPEAPEQAIDVSVMTVSVGQHQATVQGSGIAAPHYELTLSTQVSGEVIALSKQLEKGQQVSQGDVLATLHNSELSSALATAKNELASAVLALKEEQRQGQQSQDEWRDAGFEGEPSSDLVLRKPQLEVAQAQVYAAQTALAEAQDKLAHTQIKAPFDGLVISRDISPGSYLSAGTNVATLYSTDRVEITLDLANSEWLKLPTTQQLLEQQWPVLIESMDAHASWQGKVLSVDRHINTSTRLRSLVVGLASPLEQTPPLLPGAFVQVSLQGKSIDQLWQLPNSALSQKSEIWYVDEDKRLATFSTTPRFVDDKYVYIDVPEAMRNKPYQVLIQPYSSYVKGMLVHPLNTLESDSKRATP